MCGPHPLLMLWLGEELRKVDWAGAGSSVRDLRQAASFEQPQAPASQRDEYAAFLTLPP